MVNRWALVIILILSGDALNAQLAPRLVIPAGVYAVNAGGQIKVAVYSIDADRDKVNNEIPYHLLSDANNISVKTFVNDTLSPVSFGDAGIVFTGSANHREAILKNNSGQALVIYLKKNIELGGEGEVSTVRGVENWTIKGEDPDEVQNMVWIMGLQSLLNEGGAKVQVNGLIDDSTLIALNNLVNNNTKWFASDVKNYIGDVTSTARRYTARYLVSAAADSARIENFTEVQDEINDKQSGDSCYISEILYDFTENTVSLKLNCANETGYSLNITPSTITAISFSGKNKDGTQLSFGWNEKGEFESFGARSFDKH